jgi:Rad3-related DNA helicase
VFVKSIELLVDYFERVAAKWETSEKRSNTMLVEPKAHREIFEQCNIVDFLKLYR